MFSSTLFNNFDSIFNVLTYVLGFGIGALIVVTFLQRWRYWPTVDKLFRLQGFTLVIGPKAENPGPANLITATDPMFGTERTPTIRTAYRLPAQGILGLQYDVILASGREKQLPGVYGSHVPVTVLVKTLPAPVSGWAQLKSQHSPMKNSGPDIQLESIDFNKQVNVRAEPKELAQLVFPPDVMAWYLNYDRRFWVHVEGSSCAVAFEGKIDGPQFSRLVTMANEWETFVNRSGALEPPGEKA